MPDCVFLSVRLSYGWRDIGMICEYFYILTNLHFFRDKSRLEWRMFCSFADEKIGRVQNRWLEEFKKRVMINRMPVAD